MVTVSATLDVMKERIREFARCRPEWAFAPDWGDLVFLYTTVLAERPRYILELGSGHSTVALWLALEACGNGGHLVSFEADPYWYSANQEALYMVGLDHNPEVSPNKPRPFLVFNPVTTDWSRSPLFPTMSYSFAPFHDSRPDFIYVDGPALVGACDSVFERSLFSPAAKVIVVDGRLGQVRDMRRALGRYYDIHEAEGRTVFRRTG